MAKRPKFTLTFAPQAIEHLDRIESKYHGLLRRTIKEQLTDTPTDETGIGNRWSRRLRSMPPGNFVAGPRIGFGSSTTWIGVPWYGSWLLASRIETGS